MCLKSIEKCKKASKKSLAETGLCGDHLGRSIL